MVRVEMEIKIVKETENPFFKRKDLVLDIAHAGASTPKVAELKEQLAAKYSVHESQVVVDFIMSKRGLQESEAKVKILSERPPIVEEEPKEEKPSEEKPAAEEPSAEKPKEEKKADEAQASETK